jgi:hypothetical protein
VRRGDPKRFSLHALHGDQPNYVPGLQRSYYQEGGGVGAALASPQNTDVGRLVGRALLILVDEPLKRFLNRQSIINGLLLVELDKAAIPTQIE